MTQRPNFYVERDSLKQTALFEQIQNLADSEKESLGFLPVVALRDAIARKRMLVAFIEHGGERALAGYLLHSGVFPHAKVQQIAVVPKLRKASVASGLLRAFCSDLEKVGFLTVRADIASEMESAISFYQKNGFVCVRTRQGGMARNRLIAIHIKQLQTDSLFSYPKVGIEADLGIRRRSAGQQPFYAFDINVYFDLAKNRTNAAKAQKLFGEALAHNIKLVVADEFVVELRRESKNSVDPILHLAMQLPRLPNIAKTEIEKVAEQIHDIVFVKTQLKAASSPQAISDSKHLAHAVLSRASAFITRDGPILRARTELLSRFGIDVAALDEIVSLLPSEETEQERLVGDGFRSSTISEEGSVEYFTDAGLDHSLIEKFCVSTGNCIVRREALTDGNRVIAVGISLTSKGVDASTQLLVHVRPEHPNSEMFADHILDVLLKTACKESAIHVGLAHLPGQSAINSLASARGFVRRPANNIYSKLALGRPLTSENWNDTVHSLRRRAGIVLPDSFPKGKLSASAISLKYSSGQQAELDPRSLEAFLSPTIFVWPGRNGVIVPITSGYADELLGTSNQARFEFIGSKNAAFMSQRGYVNSPKTAQLMRPDNVIIFYESKRDGKGRGAAVAIARIANSLIVKKSEVTNELHKKLVVDTVEPFSSTDDVLLTTFDNLFILPKPVPFARLKQNDSIGKANLISAVRLNSEQVTKIVAQGWVGDKIK